MRKFTSIALSACLCLGALVGCKTDDDATTAATASAAIEATTTQAEATTAPTETTAEATTPETTMAATTTAAPTTAAPTAAPTTEAPTLPADPKYTIPTEMTEKLTTQAEKHGFTFGGCIGNNEMNNAGYKSMIADNFASVTATNELKAYSLLNQKASKEDPNGMPGMYYGNADKIVKWAQENGLGVRGHVLVWDAYMTDWFFREGYDSKGEYVDAETMKKRLEYYIDAVITHFETEFPGVVYCWDVVNEAVGDSSSEYAAGDPCHIRTKRNGEDNIFYTKVGEDYIYLSFLYARNTVEKLGANIKLFYNDYNTFYSDKRNAIINLVKNINSYAKNADGT
ncbi:MAG: endo-1,4-beta-xylanase, partial [Lachnospiraceae bacterium]|nr:endo-1,4-beta-xylanase [Lachnospiraceae bacterium]